MTQQGSLIKKHIENNFKILYWGFRDLAEKIYRYIYFQISGICIYVNLIFPIS